jgi:hypothetical protein
MGMWDEQLIHELFWSIDPSRVLPTTKNGVFEIKKESNRQEEKIMGTTT